VATKPKITWDVVKQSKRYQAAMDGRVLAVVFYDDRASASLFPWRIRATWTHQDWPEYDTLEGAQRRVERAYVTYQAEQAARRATAAPRMRGLFDGNE
jgi:hypothetical protein